MRPRVATVLTAREWEPALVEAARRSAVVRLVARAYQPEDVPVDDLDIIVAGVETVWVSAAQVAGWQRRGCRVVGMHPSGDTPGRDLLIRAGADEVLADHMDPDEVLARLRVLSLEPRPIEPSGWVVAVTGALGSPGRTETALALASILSEAGSSMLVDLDPDGPSLSLRLRLAPQPSIVDVADALRQAPCIPSNMAWETTGLRVVTGAFGRSTLPIAARRDVLLAARDAHRWVVYDAGPARDHTTTSDGDEVVFVCDASPTGIVRAAQVMARWLGPPPRLVLNRIGDRPDDAVVAARRATGLEPAALIPYVEQIRLAALDGRRPDRAFRRSLRPLVEAILQDAPAPPTRS